MPWKKAILLAKAQSSPRRTCLSSLRALRLCVKLCSSARHPPLDLGQQFRLALNPHADL
jgi:hypothetical protein